MNDQVQIYFTVYLRSGIIIARQHGHLRKAVLVQYNPIYSKDALAPTSPLPGRYAFTRPSPDRSRLYLDDCASNRAFTSRKDFLVGRICLVTQARAITSLAVLDMLRARGQRYLSLSPALSLSFTPLISDFPTVTFLLEISK
jgi:hypothetical protein